MQKSTQFKLNPPPKPIKTSAKSSQNPEKPTITAEIDAKSTSPTLVEFQTQNAQLPDWRMQLKNAVQKRKGKISEDSEQVSNVQTITKVPEQSLPTSGANALKAETFEEFQPNNAENAQLASALKRIERSRQKYYIPEEVPEPVELTQETKTEKDFPFKIASRNENPILESKEDLKSSTNFPAKPTLVPNNLNTQPGDSLYNTSELDPNFIPAKIASSFEKQETDKKTGITEQVPQTKSVTKKETPNKPVKTQTTIAKAKITTEKKVIEVETNEDYAPFALRFNSGVFDLLVCSFASMILLSPFMLLGGNWFTVTGGFAFIATCSIVMFIYMTTTIGLFGKTFGMHLFSLEMIDYEDDEYPTFHQAAVSSSIYLLSVAFAGLGFVSAFFDEDKRAVHDLVSGTLIVKEL